VVAAHLDRLVTLVRLATVMHQHAPLLLLLLLLLAVALVLTRDAVTVGLRSDDVVVQQLTLGEQLSTIRVAPRAP